MKQLTILALMLFMIHSAHSQTKNFIDQPYIEVSGSADTLVTPNEIYIRILLSENDITDKRSEINPRRDTESSYVLPIY